MTEKSYQSSGETIQIYCLYLELEDIAGSHCMNGHNELCCFHSHYTYACLLFIMILLLCRAHVYHCFSVLYTQSFMQKSKLCFQIEDRLDFRNIIWWACHIVCITPNQRLCLCNQRHHYFCKEKYEF